MTNAFDMVIPAGAIPTVAPDRRRWAISFWRGLVLCLLFSLMMCPEFGRGLDGSSAGLFAQAAAGFRYIDLLLLALVLAHVVAFACQHRTPLSVPHALAVPGFLFLVCIGTAIAYGYLRGGNNFFFDWRALALGIGLYFVYSVWLQTPEDLAFAVQVFAIYMAARSIFLYLLFFAAGGDTLLGISIPVFDGPTISCIVFVALLALTCCAHAGHGRTRFAWISLTVAACMLVVLCLRRTYWAELAIGSIVLILARKRHRTRNLVLSVLVLVVAMEISGTTFSDRLRSLDFTGADTAFSADNSDHLNDLVDAWDQVRQSPVMGIGLGTRYPTWHIRNWKPESVMVHNAPLHVWLKYGLAGLIFYLWFHLALLRWLWRKSRVAAAAPRDFLTATFAYLLAQFLVTLGFAPWPYSELQLTTLTSFLLAGAVVASKPIPQVHPCPYRLSPS